MDIEVRPLLVDDVFVVARMLSKVTKAARAEIASAIKASKKDEKPDPTELGMVLCQSMFAEAEGDLKAWMANLIGKTESEFVGMSATTVIDIIEKLAKQEDLKDFLARVSQLVSRVEGSAPLDS